MPQASRELRAEFPGGDEEAWDVLRANFGCTRGGLIHPKDDNYTPTYREWDAIDYLCDEWDYGYYPKAVDNSVVI